jgi:uncharacterized protein YbaP (TraB family)
MRSTFFLFISFLTNFLGLQVFAQDEQADVIEVTAGDNKSLLWRISGNQLPQASYVFGTMHAICQEDYFFTEAMHMALSKSQQLILEVDLTAPEMQDLMRGDLMLPDGEQLSDYFSNEDQFQQFSDQVMQKTGIDVNVFRTFKPFVLISTLSMKGFTCPVTESYEMNLVEKVQTNGTPVIGLETASAQMQLFDQLTKAEIAAMLWETISDQPEVQQQQQDMVALYKQQDIDALAQLIKGAAGFKGHEKKFITDRNHNWAKQLPALLKSSPSFIAVGAGHLPGEEGLLNLLRKAGYTVEAMK